MKIKKMLNGNSTGVPACRAMAQAPRRSTAVRKRAIAGMARFGVATNTASKKKAKQVPAMDAKQIDVTVRITFEATGSAA